MFNLKKISIIVVIVILAFIAYSYMISGNSKSSSGVTKQNVAGGTAVTPGSAALDGPGKDFVTQLLAIQNIKFNLDLFSDPVFLGLQDYSRDLVPQESGRPNPFAPLDGDTSSASAGTAFSGFSPGTADVIAPPDSTSNNTAPANTNTGTKTPAKASGKK